MFALTCPHCQNEIKTRVARPGATVKCMACQQTYVLDETHIRTLEEPAPAAPANAEFEADPREKSSPADTKMTMAAISAMAKTLSAPEPQVDIYAGQPAINPDTLRLLIKLALALTVLVAVIVGAIWLLRAQPAQKLPPAKPPVRLHHEPGTTPASEF